MVRYMHGDYEKRQPTKQIADVPREFDELFDRLDDELKLDICEWLYVNNFLLVIRKHNK